MEQEVVYSEHTPAGNIRHYIAGFTLSVLFTLTAFTLVEIHVKSLHDTFSHLFLIAATISLAIIQFFAQLYFFLHLGQETRPRWKLLVLAGMITVVLILVGGSLWIMYNLNYRMTPAQINSYMQKQDGGL